MKKLLLIMLLTFASMTSADEGRYTMVNANADVDRKTGGIYILDTEKGDIRFCYFYNDGFSVPCTDWTKGEQKK